MGAIMSTLNANIAKALAIPANNRTGGSRRPDFQNIDSPVTSKPERTASRIRPWVALLLSKADAVPVTAFRLRTAQSTGRASGRLDASAHWSGRIGPQAPISAGEIDPTRVPSAAYSRFTINQNEWDRDQHRVE